MQTPVGHPRLAVLEPAKNIPPTARNRRQLRRRLVFASQQSEWSSCVISEKGTDYEADSSGEGADLSVVDASSYLPGSVTSNTVPLPCARSRIRTRPFMRSTKVRTRYRPSPVPGLARLSSEPGRTKRKKTRHR